MLNVGEDPFKFWLRVDEGHQTVGVRFEAQDGRGILSLRQREDPSPVSHYEELDIDLESIRGGRFLQVQPSGNRRSYAMSRLVSDVLGRMPPGRWIELDAITEHGFRYLVIPAGQAESKPPAAAVKAPAAETRQRPAVVASVPAGAPAVPRQTPVAPALAREALSRLSHQEAIQYLQHEMAKVEALHQHIAELERRLAMSEAREKDLMTVLQRWQAH